jgi:hypothetical protein
LWCCGKHKEINTKQYKNRKSSQKIIRAGEVTKEKMKNRKIISIVLGSLLALIAISMLFFGDIESNSIQSQKIQYENDNSKYEKTQNNENSNTESEINDDENNAGSEEENKKWGRIKLQVFYSTSYAGITMPRIPVQYAKVTLESVDGDITRKGYTNIRGVNSFKFLPPEQDYILKISKKDDQLIEEVVTMTPDEKLNNVIIYL